MNSKTLAQNAFFNIIYKVLNVIFPLITFAYVARILFASGVGRTAAVQNNISYFVLFASLGIPTYGIREIAKVRDKKEKLNSTYSELIFLNFLFTTVSLVVFFILAHSVWRKSSDINLYYIYSGLIFLNYINVDWLYQGLEEYKYIAFRSTLVKIVSLVLTLMFVRSQSDIYKYAIISVIATSGNYIFNIFNSKNFVKITFSGIHIKRHIKPLVYLALCTISTELYARMDITMLNIISDSKTVGFYTYSQKIINIVITLLVAITSVFLPRLSYYYENNKEKFKELVKFGFENMILLSIPTCIGMMLLSKSIVLVLLGHDFLPAYTTIIILSLMIPLKCIGDIICYQVMICAGREVVLMKSYFIIMVVNFINNLLLIPLFEAKGAAVASVISEILAFLFVLHYSRKYINLKLKSSNIIKTIISTIAMGVVVTLLSKIISFEFMKLVLSVICGVAIYLIINLLLKNDYVLICLKYIKSRKIKK